MLPQGRTRTGTLPAQPEFFSQHCQTHFQDVAVGPHQFVVPFMSLFPQTSGAGCHPSVALRAVALEPGSLGTDFCPWFEAHGAGLCKRRAHSPRLFPGAKPGYFRAVPQLAVGLAVPAQFGLCNFGLGLFPIPHPWLCVLPQGAAQAWICELIWVKEKKKGEKAILIPFGELPRLGW